MATSNFTRYNVIYTQDFTDEENNDLTEIEFDDMQCEVLSQLEAVGASNVYDQKIRYWSSSRIYAIFHMWQNSTIEILGTSGYYSGYSFDYIVNIDDDDEDRRIKTIQKQTQTTINKIKRAFKKAWLYELRVQWTASNGETWYQKI